MNFSFGPPFALASPPPFTDEGEIHVWLFDPRACDVDEPRVLDFAKCSLSEEELRAGASKANSNDRIHYYLSKMFVRTVLCGYVPHETKMARCMQFKRESFGKPTLVATTSDAVGTLEFNLSHTRSLMALAVTRGSHLGIDVESTARDVQGDPRRLARRYFSKREYEAMFGLPVRDAWPGWSILGDSERLLHHWTLKESFAKATGLGISRTGLSSLSFSFLPSTSLHANGPASVDVQFEVKSHKILSQEVAKYSFFHYHVDEEHILSLCCGPMSESSSNRTYGPAHIVFFRTPHASPPGHRFVTREVTLLAFKRARTTLSPCAP